MGLRVVGTGLGRTGTKSMQTALSILGFGPCHHMIEVLQHPDTMALWLEADSGRPDWNAIFRGYQSAVDYPTAGYWRELTSHFPAAKVLHTVRDADDWFESVSATILAPDSIARRGGADVQARFFASVRRRMPEQADDRTVMTEFFIRHTEEVKAAIAPERLLIYQMGEGWDRLCAFLGVPVPSMPFPAENARAEFIGRSAALGPGIASH